MTHQGNLFLVRLCGILLCFLKCTCRQFQLLLAHFQLLLLLDVFTYVADMLVLVGLGSLDTIGCLVVVRSGSALLSAGLLPVIAEHGGRSDQLIDPVHCPANAKKLVLVLGVLS